MSDLIAMIQSEVSRQLRTHFTDIYGTVTSYDPDKHLAKVKIKPEDFETGWLRINEPAIGNGYGIVTGLTVGDQVKLTPTSGDVNSLMISGRLHSDADAPPRAESGEIVIRHTSGMTAKFAKDGTLNITGSDNITLNGVTIDPNGNIVTPGDVTAGTVSLKTHVHTGVTAGADLSGAPQV